MPSPDTSQRISADTLHSQRLGSLEKRADAHTDAIAALNLHRERSETRWTLVAALGAPMRQVGVTIMGYVEVMR